MSAVVCAQCSLDLELPSNGIEIPGCRCIFHEHCWEMAKEHMVFGGRCPRCDSLNDALGTDIPLGQPSQPQTLQDQEDSSGTSGGAEGETARTTEQHALAQEGEKAEDDEEEGAKTAGEEGKSAAATDAQQEDEAQEEKEEEGKPEEAEDQVAGAAEEQIARKTEQVARMTEQPPLLAASSNAEASQLVAMAAEPTCFLCGSRDEKMKTSGGKKTQAKHKCRRCCSIDTVHALYMVWRFGVVAVVEDFCVGLACV